jgi:hypothetical protein
MNDVERGPGGWPVDPQIAFGECHEKLVKARKDADHWRSNFNYLKADLLKRSGEDLARRNFELENEVRGLRHDLMHAEEGEEGWEAEHDKVLAQLHQVAESHHPGASSCEHCRPIVESLKSKGGADTEG